MAHNVHETPMLKVSGQALAYARGSDPPQETLEKLSRAVDI
jgi:hypothetical protein